MSSFSQQIVRKPIPHGILLHRNSLKRNRLQRRKLNCRAESGIRSEALRSNPRFSTQDVERICSEGPRYEDLTEHHIIQKSESVSDAHTEKIEFIRPQTLGKDPYVKEPTWREIEQVPFMKFHKGIEQRNWRSEFYDPTSEPWKILFFEDSGRLFRPSFSGYRALILEDDKPPRWCDLADPGLNMHEEDVLVPKEIDNMIPEYRTNTFGYPADYGYLQLFHRIGVAFQRKLPEDEYLVDVMDITGALDPEYAEEVHSPSHELLDISFHLTGQELCLHGVWFWIPRVAFIAFAFSFLGVCLFVGIFKPKKQMPADPMQAMEFAQSKGRARKDGRTGVKFTDIAGLENIVDDLMDVVEFLKEPSKYKGLHAKPPKGILIEGPPGTGKTLIAKAIAGEAGVPFYQMSGSEFVEAIVGVGAARVRDLFKRARAQAEACIIFVDEIDALGTKRSEAGVSTNEEREQTLNQLLTEMDGFSSEMGVVFVGATNRADLLDPALQRPGRFDRKVRIIKPTTEGRHQILLTHAKKHKLGKDVDLLQLARDLPGLAGAQLSSILNEAALEAIRRDAHEINSTDIYNAVDRVIQGIRRPVQPYEMSNGKIFAVHEMGRAIVAIVLRERTGRLEAVEKLSLVARGKDETRTIFFRGKDEDYTMTTRARILERISVILAGRAAEEHFFGDPSTYSSKDLGPAFRLTQKLVGNYGLSDLGLISYAPVVPNSAIIKHSFEVNVDNIDEDLFGKGLGGGMYQSSDANFHKFLTKCYEIMSKAYEESLEIIQSYSNALDAGSNILLEKTELTGAEVEKIVRQYPPKPLQKPIAAGKKVEDYIPTEPSPLSLRTNDFDHKQETETIERAVTRT